MDKYEYRIKAEQIRKLAEQEDFVSAMKIANTIDWNRVRSIPMLCLVGEIYEKNNMLEESRDVMLIAYDRHPYGRMIIYSLAELSIRLEEYIDAVEYYKEFVQVAPRDTGRYILQYKLYEAQHVGLQERIAVLEEFKRHEYVEKWAFELAYLYHRAGMKEKCVAECDELILWFADGKYVEKAMELKMIYAPLTEEQQKKYDSRNDIQIEKSIAAVEAVAEKPKEEETEIEVKTLNYGIYDTVNLQKELARSMQQILDVTKQEPTENIKDNAAVVVQDKQEKTVASEKEEEEKTESEKKPDDNQIMEEASILLQQITNTSQQTEQEADVKPYHTKAAETESKEDLEKTKIFEFDINEAPTKIIPVKEIKAQLQKNIEVRKPVEEKEVPHMQVSLESEGISKSEVIQELPEENNLSYIQTLSKTEETNLSEQMTENFVEEIPNETEISDEATDKKEENFVSYEDKESISESEREILEKQATCQMNIEEVLKEWERIKASSGDEEESEQDDMMENTMFETVTEEITEEISNVETEDEIELIADELELEFADTEVEGYKEKLEELTSEKVEEYEEEPEELEGYKEAEYEEEPEESEGYEEVEEYAGEEVEEYEEEPEELEGYKEAEYEEEPEESEGYEEVEEYAGEEVEEYEEEPEELEGYKEAEYEEEPEESEGYEEVEEYAGEEVEEYEEEPEGYEEAEYEEEPEESEGYEESEEYAGEEVEEYEEEPEEPEGYEEAEYEEEPEESEGYEESEEYAGEEVEEYEEEPEESEGYEEVEEYAGEEVEEYEEEPEGYEEAEYEEEPEESEGYEESEEYAGEEVEEYEEEPEGYKEAEYEEEQLKDIVSKRPEMVEKTMDFETIPEEKPEEDELPNIQYEAEVTKEEYEKEDKDEFKFEFGYLEDAIMREAEAALRAMGQQSSQSIESEQSEEDDLVQDESEEYQDTSDIDGRNEKDDSEGFELEVEEQDAEYETITQEEFEAYKEAQGMCEQTSEEELYGVSKASYGRQEFKETYGDVEEASYDEKEDFEETYEESEEASYDEKEDFEGTYEESEEVSYDEKEDFEETYEESEGASYDEKEDFEETYEESEEASYDEKEDFEETYEESEEASYDEKEDFEETYEESEEASYDEKEDFEGTYEESEEASYDEKEDFEETYEESEEASYDEKEDLEETYEESEEASYDKKDLEESSYEEEPFEEIHEESGISSEIEENISDESSVQEGDANVLNGETKGAEGETTSAIVSQQEEDNDSLVREEIDTEDDGEQIKLGAKEESFKKIFKYFSEIPGVSEQIIDSIGVIKEEPADGNIIIMGDTATGKTTLAAEMIKLAKKCRKFNGNKVARITGEAMNSKDIANIIESSVGGVLIVEEAASMTADTVRELDRVLEGTEEKLLVILEDSRERMMLLLEMNNSFRGKFPAVIDLPPYTNTDLVAFATSYAKEKGATIDDMGVLALYSKLAEMQFQTEFVPTLYHVKELIDQAMEKAQKKKVKPSFGRFLSKKKETDQGIVIREKDFM